MSDGAQPGPAPATLFEDACVLAVAKPSGVAVIPARGEPPGRSLQHALVEARGDFEAAHAPESNILCFRYVGDRSLDDGALDAVNFELRERYNRSGAGWITATVLGGRRVLRVTIMNPRTGPEHVERLVEGLTEAAARL